MCSFLQIYNEKIYDLLQDRVANPLSIREDKLAGLYVEGLTEYIVTNVADCFMLLKRGERNRITRHTKNNISSSRSHSIFQLIVETDEVDKRGMLKRAKLNLCDLAGSEKLDKSETIGKAHLSELKNINLSLTTLGKVISCLAKASENFMGNKKAPAPFIPYRESKITRLLQDSLGGNTVTCLIATVSPILNNLDETMSTLKFADRAKEIMFKVSANEINANDDALVSRLRSEI